MGPIEECAVGEVTARKLVWSDSDEVVRRGLLVG